MKYYTNIDILGHLALDYCQEFNQTGNLNNLATGNFSFLKFSGSAPSVSGFADGGDNNKILIIVYSGNGTLTLKNLSTLSTDINRIITGYNEDLVLQSGNSVILIYDSYDEVWRTLTAPSVLSLPQDLSTTASVTFAELNLTSNTPTTITVNTDLSIDSTGNIVIKPKDLNGYVEIDSDTASSSYTEGALIINGGVGVAGNINAFGEIAGNILKTTQSSGDEGGEIQLSTAATNSTLNGPIAIDIWRNKLRIFETSGSNRGAYIDLTAASSGVGSDLLAGGQVSSDTLSDVTGRGATTSSAISITNTTESSNRTSGALIVSGGIGVAKRVQTKNLTVDGVKHRVGISANLTSGIIDLSLDDYLIYSIDQTDDFLTDISFNNGTPGEVFYVKIKSDGQQYSWDITNDEVKWPSDVIPAASVNGKTDLYHFICITSTLYLGTYVFNYT